MPRSTKSDRPHVGKYGCWHDDAQCGEYLSITAEAVQHLWNKGYLQYTKLSGKRRSSTADLEAYVEKQREGCPPANELGKWHQQQPRGSGEAS